MLKRTIYEVLKKEYGLLSSWAIWTPPGNKPKSFTSDMSLFADEDALCQKLNPNYVFVGLNASIHNHKEVGVWSNFHSDDNRRQNDYKLRFALLGTKFEGAYITDVIKNYPEPDSKKVAKFMRQNPNILAEHIEKFKQEIALLETQPILIAMGNDPYEMLESLQEEYTIVKIPHYAARGALQSKEKYGDAVMVALKDL